MIEVRIEIKVDQPQDEVFAYISNFENNPIWQSGMEAAIFTSDPPLRVGSTYEQRAKFLGREINSTFKVIEFSHGIEVKAASTSGSFPITFTRSVEKIESGSLVKAVIEGEAKGFFKIGEPILKIFVKRSVESDYRNLKRILESQ